MLAASAIGPLERAPFLSEIAEGPATARAWWVTSADGTRLRMGLWEATTGTPRGTVLLFPGRTEYVEKYGRVARNLVACGYSVAAFDWRGQGLADRPQHRRDMGHVISFDEYRQDVAAFRRALAEIGVPEPCFLIAHSMGGAIGLRALHDGLPVSATAFTGPMWGIQMRPFLKSIAGIVLGLAGPLGFGATFAPTTGPWQPMEFDDNQLTSDRDQFDYMSAQIDRHPELALGGPSVLWVKAALLETASLMALPAPDTPTLTLVGSRESIVEVPAIHRRMATWPKGRLITIESGLHEVMMETPRLREAALGAIIDHFDAQA